jgi:cell division septation protein DedD
MKRLFVIGLALMAGVASAQDTASTSAGVDSVLRRAEAMVDVGRAVAGRVLVDSVLATTTPGTEPYAEALYARASLAATAGDAERDYLRLTVEYTLSPRSADALLRLAQLELARGDRAQARTHLSRLTEDHPAALSSPRTNLSVARAYQELGDQPHACGALAAAQHSAAPADIELRNQIDYAARPCPAVPAVDTTRKLVAAPAVATTPVVAPRPADTAGAGAAAAAFPPPPAAGPPAGSAAKSVTSQPPPTASAGPPPQPAKATTAFPPPSAAGTPTAPPPKAVAPPPRPAPPAATPVPAVAPAKGAFTVQVAAYATQAPADALAAKLTARGLPARVWGTSAPFRVRVGRYPTHAAAESAATDLKSKQIEGFVTDAEPSSTR